MNEIASPPEGGCVSPQSDCQKYMRCAFYTAPFAVCSGYVQWEKHLDESETFYIRIIRISRRKKLFLSDSSENFSLKIYEQENIEYMYIKLKSYRSSESQKYL